MIGEAAVTALLLVVVVERRIEGTGISSKRVVAVPTVARMARIINYYACRESSEIGRETSCRFCSATCPHILRLHPGRSTASTSTGSRVQEPIFSRPVVR
jgi:hypothetical protein